MAHIFSICYLPDTTITANSAKHETFQFSLIELSSINSQHATLSCPTGNVHLVIMADMSHQRDACPQIR